MSKTNYYTFDGIQDLVITKQKLASYRSYIEEMLVPLRQSYLTEDNNIKSVTPQPPQDYDRALKYSISIQLSNWIRSLDQILNIVVTNNELINLNHDIKTIAIATIINEKKLILAKKLNPEVLVDLYYANVFLNSVPSNTLELKPAAKHLRALITKLEADQAKKYGHTVSRFAQALAFSKLVPLTGLLYLTSLFPKKVIELPIFTSVKQSWCFNWVKALGVYFTVSNKTKNKKALPTNGSVVVANHPSSFEDAGFRAAFNVYCIAKSEVKDWWILGRIARSMGAIFTNRNGNARPGEITNTMVTALQSGKNIGVYPQGGCRISTNEIVINKRGELIDLFAGAFDAAIRARKPIVISYWNYKPYDKFCWVGNDSLIKNLWDILKCKRPVARLDILKIIDVEKLINKYSQELNKFSNPVIRESLIREILQDKVRKTYMRLEPGYNAKTGINTIENPVPETSQSTANVTTTLWQPSLSTKYPDTYSRYWSEQAEEVNPSVTKQSYATDALAPSRR